MIPDFDTRRTVAVLHTLEDGAIELRRHRCPRCSNAFWTETTRLRRLPAGPHHCPYCDGVARVRETSS